MFCDGQQTINQLLNLTLFLNKYLATVNSWWSRLLIKVPFTFSDSPICQGLTDIFTCAHWNLAWRTPERKKWQRFSRCKIYCDSYLDETNQVLAWKTEVQCFQMYCFPDNTLKNSKCYLSNQIKLPEILKIFLNLILSVRISYVY